VCDVLIHQPTMNNQRAIEQIRKAIDFAEENNQNINNGRFYFIVNNDKTLAFRALVNTKLDVAGAMLAIINGMKKGIVVDFSDDSEADIETVIEQFGEGVEKIMKTKLGDDFEEYTLGRVKKEFEDMINSNKLAFSLVEEPAENPPYVDQAKYEAYDSLIEYMREEKDLYNDKIEDMVEAVLEFCPDAESAAVASEILVLTGRQEVDQLESLFELVGESISELDMEYWVGTNAKNMMYMKKCVEAEVEIDSGIMYAGQGYLPSKEAMDFFFSHPHTEMEDFENIAPSYDEEMSRFAPSEKKVAGELKMYLMQKMEEEVVEEVVEEVKEGEVVEIEKEVVVVKSARESISITEVEVIEDDEEEKETQKLKKKLTKSTSKPEVKATEVKPKTKSSPIRSKTIELPEYDDEVELILEQLTESGAIDNLSVLYKWFFESFYSIGYDELMWRIYMTTASREHEFLYEWSKQLSAEMLEEMFESIEDYKHGELKTKYLLDRIEETAAGVDLALLLVPNKTAPSAYEATMIVESESFALTAGGKKKLEKAYVQTTIKAEGVWDVIKEL